MSVAGSPGNGTWIKKEILLSTGGPSNDTWDNAREKIPTDPERQTRKTIGENDWYGPGSVMTHGKTEREKIPPVTGSPGHET